MHHCGVDLESQTHSKVLLRNDGKFGGGVRGKREAGKGGEKKTCRLLG